MCRLIIIITISFFASLKTFMAWAAETVQDAQPQEVLSVMGNNETTELALAIFKVLGSLLVVVALLVVVVNLIKKIGIGRGRCSSSAIISVLDTRMIAPKKYVAVVKIAEEYVALGVTDQQISMLTKIDDSELLDSASCQAEDSKPLSFGPMLDRAKALISKQKSSGSIV